LNGGEKSDKIKETGESCDYAQKRKKDGERRHNHTVIKERIWFDEKIFAGI
jgi:hypothetical protein